METENKGQGGFTFVEILAALAAAAVISAMLIRMTAVSVRMYRRNCSIEWMEQESRRINACLDRVLMNAGDFSIQTLEHGTGGGRELRIILSRGRGSEEEYSCIYYNEEMRCLYYMEETDLENEECLLSRHVREITLETDKKASDVIHYEYELCSPEGLSVRYRSRVRMRNADSGKYPPEPIRGTSGRKLRMEE